MAVKNPVFVGIEIINAPGRLRNAYVYAALDETCQLLAIGRGDRAELLAFLGGQQSAWAAVNGPRRPNMGIHSHENPSQVGLPFEKPELPPNSRVCERLLAAEGFTLTPTPDKAADCTSWARRSFDLYQQLTEFDYGDYPGSEGPRYSLETHPEIIFWRLLKGKLPLPASLEGRLQRQLILYSLQMPVPDAMDFFLEVTRFKLIQGEVPDEKIFSIEELNALAAAYIAWQAGNQSEDIDLIGDPEEGQIVLPARMISPL